GMCEGWIYSITFDVKQPQFAPLNDFTIRIKYTSLNEFPATSFETTSALDNVFGPIQYTENAGWNIHTFDTAFFWDGTSNLLVQTCFNNFFDSRNAVAYYTSTSYFSTLYKAQNTQTVCASSSGLVSRNRPNMYFEFSSIALPQADFTADNTLNCDGIIQFTDLSVCDPQTWQWDFGDGNIDSVSQNPLYIYDSAGTYTVIVTDFNGCVDSATVTLLGLSLLIPSITDTTHVLCNGDSSGSATVTPGGITIPPYSFSWDDPALQTDSTAINLPAGTFIVIVTDGNGCSKSDTITIFQPTVLIAEAGVNDTICAGDSIVIGPPIVDTTLSYSWFPTTGLNDPTIPNPIAFPIDTTEYILTVIDINGCIDSSNIVISVGNEFLLNMVAFLYPNGYDVSCNGVSDGFLVAENVTGGTPPLSLIEFNNLPPPLIFTNLSAESYVMIISDANGCEAIDTIILTEPPASITASGTTTFCQGDSVALTSNSPTGNQWYIDGNILPGDTNQSIMIGTTGFYTLSDISACGVTIDVKLCDTILPDLCIEIIGTQLVGALPCENIITPGCVSCSQIQYEITYKNFGTTMTTPCTLIVTLPTQISYVSTLLPSPPPDTIIFGPPTQLIWTNLCDPSFDQNLIGNSIIIRAEISIHIPFCVTVPDTLIASAEFIPLDGGCDNVNQDTVIFNGPLDPNDKMLVSPQGVGVCHTVLKTDTLIYQINFQNVGTAPAHNVVIVDTLDPAKLDIFTFSLLHTSHPAAFTLTPQGILTFIFNNINLPDSAADLAGSAGFVKFSIQPVSNIAPGTVIDNTAAIYFDSNDPVITNTVMNTILGEPLQITVSGPTTFCEPDSITLTSSPANSYLWSTGDTTQSIIVNTSGTFSVADASGCLANSEPVIVTVITAPTVDAGDDQTVYIGYTPQECAILSAVASGGDPPYSYAWSTGETTQNITVCPAITTTYTVTVTDANGCSSSDEVTVNVIDVR
ncbi:MAG: PKD domain-containing protein, partial [Bacteroidetes bacterium]|nr:PKD domain-containing protein [Bacteroidota bacterium]